ncbi:hypothetical protein M0R45_032596 [Rubus argutus]|uniref:RNase H type-1 domain-containing protein n=1 Tax=Rubus argutus TaxID=59490 RepID=A0AAW1WJU1_RUBAR
MAAGPIQKFIVNDKNEIFVHKIVWTPPFAGPWKLNYVYACNRTSRKSFVGCILRCQNADFKALYAGPVGQDAGSSTDAALMAMTCAIGLAASQGGDSLEIEGENETMFSLVTGQIPPTNEATRELVARCLQELHNLRRVVFRCVQPDANEAATLLAKMAMETEETWFCVDNPPPEIAAILDADVNGRYVPWVHLQSNM